MKTVLTFLAVGVLVFSTSCLKKDIQVELPPLDTALYTQEFYLGDYYEYQLFFNLTNNRIIHSSKSNSWDLAFENGDAGYHIYMNGGKNVQLFNVGQHNFKNFLKLPATPITWGFDDPSWNMSKTYVGDWRIKTQTSKPDLFLVNLGGDSIMKVVFKSVSPQQYEIEYGELKDSIAKTIVIKKDNDYSLSYFTFNNHGEVVMPDAKADEFDLLFTPYKHIYYDLNNFPYIVNGAMLNMRNISATIDSVNSFDKIDKSTIPDYNFSRDRDIIGFDWKTYDINQGRYSVRKNRTYIIRKDNGSTWKLKFINFYNKDGLKGYPSFEYKRID